MTPFERLQPLLILLGVLLGLGLAQMTRLATLAGELITPLLMAMLLPIKTESRRRHIQRFLKLANLSVTTLWLPIVKSLKDCKSGGYNLEGSHASLERLTRLVLLIAIAQEI